MKLNKIHLDVIDSTNLYARQNCSKFPPDQITCITAEEQTAGRGRYQRKWVSPRSVNIYATFYFKLPSNILHLSSISQVMALSLATILMEEGLHPQIKWPNDIQLNDKKLSGILCETCFHKEHVDICLGIGINVNLDKESAEKIDQPATSLFIETQKVWDKELLLEKLQKRFLSNLEIFKTSGFNSFHPLFENLLAYKGQTVCCFDGKKEWVGVCHSITEDGQLNLYMPDHTIHTVSSGDLHL
jgi:BirA family biotin operon repressor/biotin-[acetyl-CoA-carboxylase] ligase